MSRLPASLLLLVALMAAGCSSAPVDGSPRPSADDAALPAGTLTIRTSGSEVRLSVEIARTPEARAAGLMHREELPADAGMVFLFDQPTDAGFWMKDTLIPLSIAFWDANRDIVAMLDMAPCRQDPCPLFSPGVTYAGAVEVNRGWFVRHGVGLGDQVEVLIAQP